MNLVLVSFVCISISLCTSCVADSDSVKCHFEIKFCAYVNIQCNDVLEKTYVMCMLTAYEIIVECISALPATRYDFVYSLFCLVRLINALYVYE